MAVISALLLISCAKSECKASPDCPQKACSAPRCDNGKCIPNPIPNCCGNGAPESLEGGKPGNKCTCPQDYGKCEGKGQVKAGSRMEDAAYAHYYCNSGNECIMGVESKDASPQNYLDSMTAEYFKASAVLKYNKPFDMSKDTFELKITLDDTNKDIVMPVKFSSVRILLSTDSSRGEQLVADKDFEIEIFNIKDTTSLSVPLNLNYRPQQVEEPGLIRYTVDYSYTKKIVSGRNPDSSPIYQQQLARERFNSPSKQVFLVRGG